jgi:ribosome-binding factor A
MAKEFSRNQRLGSQIRRSLSDLLLLESKDPAIASISLTKVELTRDLSVAKVYFSLLNPEDDPQAALDGLQRASGFLRSRLGSALKVRHVPELRYVHDDSAAFSDEISRLLDSAKKV